ncbi:hypothetical protein MHYP_G00132440 [Metynnis hypsauchen]
MACAEFGAAFYLSGFSNNQDTFSSGSSLRQAGDPAGLDEAQRKRQNGAINKHPLPAIVNSYATERTFDKSFQFKHSRKANLFSLYVLKISQSEAVFLIGGESSAIGSRGAAT